MRRSLKKTFVVLALTLFVFGLVFPNMSSAQSQGDQTCGQCIGSQHPEIVKFAHNHGLDAKDLSGKTRREYINSVKNNNVFKEKVTQSGQLDMDTASVKLVTGHPKFKNGIVVVEGTLKNGSAMGFLEDACLLVCGITLGTACVPCIAAGLGATVASVQSCAIANWE